MNYLRVMRILIFVLFMILQPNVIASPTKVMAKEGKSVFAYVFKTNGDVLEYRVSKSDVWTALKKNPIHLDLDQYGAYPLFTIEKNQDILYLLNHTNIFQFRIGQDGKLIRLRTVKLQKDLYIGDLGFYKTLIFYSKNRNLAYIPIDGKGVHRDEEQLLRLALSKNGEIGGLSYQSFPLGDHLVISPDHKYIVEKRKLMTNNNVVYKDVLYIYQILENGELKLNNQIDFDGFDVYYQFGKYGNILYLSKSPYLASDSTNFHNFVEVYQIDDGKLLLKNKYAVSDWANWMGYNRQFNLFFCSDSVSFIDQFTIKNDGTLQSIASFDAWPRDVEHVSVDIDSMDFNDFYKTAYVSPRGNKILQFKIDRKHGLKLFTPSAVFSGYRPPYSTVFDPFNKHIYVSHLEDGIYRAELNSNGSIKDFEPFKVDEWGHEFSLICFVEK